MLTVTLMCTGRDAVTTEVQKYDADAADERDDGRCCGHRNALRVTRVDAPSRPACKMLTLDLNTAMGHSLDTNESIAQAVVAAATQAEAVMIITLTSSGNSARLISK